jgi:hypothetical protein
VPAAYHLVFPSAQVPLGSLDFVVYYMAHLRVDSPAVMAGQEKAIDLGDYPYCNSRLDGRLGRGL